MPTLYYYHDPMCSWCWGYRPTAALLFANLPATIELKKVLGGLAPDSDTPMPSAIQEMIMGHWRRIESLLGTQFNYDFWTQCEPRRSTFPSCRAVIAAANQAREDEMIEAIQRGYYLRAMNPSDTATLAALAKEIGADAERFEKDLHSDATETELQRQIEFTGRSPITGLPSLAVDLESGLAPLDLDYRDHRKTLALLDRLLKRG